LTLEERKTRIRKYLGKTVNVVIDRPLGSAHPKYPNTVYPVNYGYIPNTVGGDGEEQDVYLLGVDRPVESCTCRVIGIIHRRRDREDKLVAAPVGMEFHQAEIEEAVRFCEKYHIHYVEAMVERSCGTVPYTVIDGKVRFLLIAGGDGYCGFPKGHMECGESERETALRETWEETSVRVSLKDGFVREAAYPIGRGKTKRVVYFLASFEGQHPRHNEGFENNELLLLPFEEAVRRLTHRDSKKILEDAYAAIGIVNK